MELVKAVDNAGTATERKRSASAYVIDYRGLSDDEIKVALKKTAPQYYFEDNVGTVLQELILSYAGWRILWCILPGINPLDRERECSVRSNA